jgi:hypothetical protein
MNGTLPQRAFGVPRPAHLLRYDAGCTPVSML